MEQKVLSADNNYQQLDEHFKELDANSVFLVCGKSMQRLNICRYFDTLPERLGVKVVRFSDFVPNPRYESVVDGIEKFHASGCDVIVAVGGGSPMDVAKAIKLYANLEEGSDYFHQSIVPNDVPFIAIPTTAGSGSEATRYSVLCYEGEKRSINDYSGIPSAVVLDPSVLDSLPMYQRQSTMLDALCHGIESFWAVQSTDESRAYARKAIGMVMDNMESYLRNEPEGNKNMLQASYIAGKAINVTQTTAGHAMSYKLTMRYDLAHGFACALCVNVLWPYMLEHIDEYNDPRGVDYLKGMFANLAEAMGCGEAEEGAATFRRILNSMSLEVPKVRDEGDFLILRGSVNPARLKNHPVRLSEESIEQLYRNILLI